MKLAAQGRHRLPHDRVPQPQQHLVLLEPQHPTARDLLFDQSRVEHQFHAVGAWSDRERLPGKPFPSGRRLEPIEARLARDLLQ